MLNYVSIPIFFFLFSFFRLDEQKIVQSLNAEGFVLCSPETGGLYYVRYTGDNESMVTLAYQTDVELHYVRNSVVPRTGHFRVLIYLCNTE